VVEEKICFFIAPIGEDGSRERDRSDQIRDFVIKPAARQFGFKVIRADEISKSGMITSQVIGHIFESPLVIADIGTSNANVFYELALRHAIRKPFIQIYEEGQAIPFDVSNLRSVPLKYGDYRSAENCKKKIEEQITEIEKNPSDVESPVSVAIDLKQLTASGKPIEQKMGMIMEILENLNGQVTELKLQLIPPYQLSSKVGVPGATQFITAFDPTPGYTSNVAARMNQLYGTAYQDESIFRPPMSTPKTPPKKDE